MITALLASRHLTSPSHYQQLAEALTELGTTHLLHGAEGAARQHAERWARETGNGQTGYVPDWKNLGRAAGPIRGKQLVADADNILALWDGKSQGTANELKEARRQGKRVKLILV